jgi:hypothetical protein
MSLLDIFKPKGNEDVPAEGEASEAKAEETPETLPPPPEVINVDPDKVATPEEEKKEQV